MKEIDSDAETMFKAVQNISAFKPGCLMCLEFLMAQSDYQEFIVMMLDFKAASAW